MKYIYTILFLAICFTAFSQPASFTPRGIGGGGALFFPKINPANDNEFYISCDMSEMFHSTDFGDSYSIVHFSKLQALNVSTYEYTNDPKIAYCNFNDGNNGYPVKTTDGGASWKKLPGFNANLGMVYRMYANYNNPLQLVMNYYGDIVFSANGGGTFSLVKTRANNGVGLIACGVFYDGDNIYIGTNEGIFYSNNGGSTFSPMNTAGITSGQVMWHFSGAKTGGTTRFLCITGNSTDIYNGLMPYDYYNVAKGVYTMDNATGAWVSKSSGINFIKDFIMYTGMAGNDVNTMYLAGNDNILGAPLIFKSTDAGANWTKVFQGTNNQNIKTGWSGYQGDKNWSWGESAFGIAVAPNNSNKILFGDYGFVHVSSDGGANWKQAYVNNADQHPAGSATPTKKAYTSIGLENTTCWQIHWKDANNVFACFSDIGGIRSTDGGQKWGYNYNGFSVNSLYRIVETPNGNLYGGCSNIHDMYQSTRLADAKLDAADANGKIVFSTNSGSDWTTLHTFGHPVYWLASDPNKPDRMYASVVHYGGGTGQGGIWMTDDLSKGATSTWTKLPNPATRTEGHPACIEVLNDGKMVCTYSGRRNASGAFTNSSGVFIYDPVGKTWTDVSHPGMYYWTMDIVIDPNDKAQNTWYVGVFSGWGGAPNALGGLYKTTNRGTNWTKLTGLQFDRVNSITFNPQSLNEAYLTTETQGLWVSKNMNAATPTWALVDAYPFRQPERVYFNPFNKNEMWVSSFGNGMKVGNLQGGSAPSAPFLVSPVNAAVNQKIPVSLVWKKSSGATSYRVQVSLDAGFTAPLVLDQGAITDSILQAGSLAKNTTYNWRVLAENSNGPSPWSAVWTFATEAENDTIQAPELVEPYDKARINMVRFKWNPVTKAVKYKLSIADASFPSVPIYLNDTILTTKISAGEIFSIGPWYNWKVAAYDGKIWSEWSTEWSFQLIPLGVVDNSISGTLMVSISPNPAVSRFNLSVNSNIDDMIEINMVDILGKEIGVSMICSILKGENKIQFNPAVDKSSSIPNGIYFLKIKGNKVSAIEKLWISK